MFFLSINMHQIRFNVSQKLVQEVIPLALGHVSPKSTLLHFLLNRIMVSKINVCTITTADQKEFPPGFLLFVFVLPCPLRQVARV